MPSRSEIHNQIARENAIRNAEKVLEFCKERKRLRHNATKFALLGLEIEDFIKLYKRFMRSDFPDQEKFEDFLNRMLVWREKNRKSLSDR